MTTQRILVRAKFGPTKSWRESLPDATASLKLKAFELLDLYLTIANH